MNRTIAFTVLAFLFATSAASAAVVQASASLVVDGGSPINVPVSFSPEFEIYGIGSWDPENEQFSGFEQTLAEIGPLPIDSWYRRRSGSIVAGGLRCEHGIELAIALVAASGRVRKIVRDYVERLHARANASGR